MKRKTTAYDLAFVEPGWIAARGPDEAMQGLRAWPGSTFRTGRETGTYVLLPESKLAFLAAEAMCPVTSLSPSYLEARRRAMTTPAETMALVSSLFQGMARPLLPHQIEFCAQAKELRGAYNASEQGTGKTAMAWAMADLWCAERVLIVTSASLCKQWAREVNDMWPPSYWPWWLLSLGEGRVDERIATLARSTCVDCRAVMVNYEVLDRMCPAIQEHLDPDLVIFDESWRFKNPKAQVTQAATELADRAGHVLCLAGTPVGQHAADLYSQLRLLDAGLVTGYTWDSFATRFCRMEPVKIAGRMTTRPRGIADPAGLMRLLEPVWYRATKATCLHLPPQRDEVVRLPLSERMETLYHRVENQGEYALGCELSLAGEQVVSLRLAQLAGGHVPTPSGPGQAATWALLPAPDCPKIAWLKEFVDRELEGDASVRLLVWTHYTHEADRIGAVLEGLFPSQVAVVHGKVKASAQDLEDIKDSFNSRAEDGIRVVACTLDKMAFGHNLQAADLSVFFSLTYRNITHLQARDRNHRLGRVGEVRYYYLLAQDTIDVEIYDALQAGQDLHRQVAPDTVGVVCG